MRNLKPPDKLLSIILSVAALVLLSLFVGNVALLSLAICLNNHICAQAAHAGARSYIAGATQQEVQSAVLHSVNQSNVGGYFIQPSGTNRIKVLHRFQGKLQTADAVCQDSNRGSCTGTLSAIFSPPS